MLRERGVSVALRPVSTPEDLFLAVAIDRSKSSPCIIASPTTSGEDQRSQARTFLFDYRIGFEKNVVPAIAEHMNLRPNSVTALSTLIETLLQIFHSKEASLLETRIGLDDEGSLQVRGAEFGFDDAAFRSNRQLDVQKLRDVQDEVPEEVEAEKDGIVYIKFVSVSSSSGKQTRLTGDRFPGEGNIGTLGQAVIHRAISMDMLTFISERSRSCHEHGGRAGRSRRHMCQLPRHRRQSNHRDGKKLLPDHPER